MKQEIVCNRGRCHDEANVMTELDYITNESDLSQKIQLDLLKEMVR